MFRKKHIPSVMEKRQVLTPAEVERRLYGAPLPDLNRPPPLTSLSAGAAEARATLSKLSSTPQQEKGTLIMPDLKSALQKAIESWEPAPTSQPKENTMNTPVKPYFSVTNNVMRSTFDYVKQNPSTTSKAAIADLTSRGFKESSVSSILTQLVRSGQVRKTGKSYFAVVDAYMPIKAGIKTQKKAPKAPIRTEKPTQAGIAALQPSVVEKPMMPRTASTEEILSSLNILQARALYDELKKVFGG